jgi:hypothetical protein
MLLFMENPPGNPPVKKPQANATIQIDRVDLDEILLLDNLPEEGAPPVAPGTSVPPPLPPEEIARAASLAPIGSVPPAKASSSRTALIVVGFVAIVAVAITAGVFFGNAVRSNPQPVSAASAASALTATSAAPAQTAAPVATQTITIHTMELGGKDNADP